MASRNTSGNGLKSAGASLNGLQESAKIIANIINRTIEINHPELEQKCRDALTCVGDHAAIASFDASKTSTKKNDAKVMDIFSSTLSNASSTSLTPAQLKNQSLRFGIEDLSASGSKTGSGWSTFSNSRLFNVLSGTSSTTLLDSREYEDVVDPQVLNAPICDICIVQRGDVIPHGFYRISKSPGNRKANLNSGSGGNNIFLCIKKDLTNELPPVTAIIVFFPDKGEFVPPGFVPVKRGKHACNLNSGTIVERIFLAFKRDKFGNAITDLQIIFPQKNEEIPKSFCMIDKTISGQQANLNAGTGGLKIMLTYRHKLSRLECLANEPTPLSSLDVTANSPPNRTSKTISRGGRSSSVHIAPAHIVKSSSTSNIPDKSEASMNHEIPLQILEKSDSADLNETNGDDVSEVAGDIDEYDEFDATSVMSELHFVSRSLQHVVDCDGRLPPCDSRKCLNAILSALYTHNDDVAKIALDGLLTLVKDTDFFHHEMKGLPISGTITMLDVMVEAVCDRFDMCSDSSHEKVLQFIRTLVRFISGRFGSLSLQKIYRSLAYLMAYYSTRSSWMFIPPYLPVNDGASDILTLKVFKELIVVNVAHIELVDVAQYLPIEQVSGEVAGYAQIHGNLSTSASLVREVIEDVIEDALENVETSRIIESISILVSKNTLTLSSATLWDQIRIHSRRLFSDPAYRRVFMILCALCKSSWQQVRMIPATEDPNARDLGTKLLGLEALLEFCKSAGEKMRLSKVMGYAVRRLVVPCILFNVHYGLTDHRVFSKILKIISALWKVWRVHLRMEFAILCEYLMTKILQASQLAVKPIYQMIVLQEVVTWFDQPSLILEMFVNYDLDNRFVSHWNVFSYLIRAVCAIARRTSNVTSAWNWRQTGNAIHDNGVNFREVHICALEEVATISKTLMDATGHAFLIQQDSSFRSRTLGIGQGWEEDIEPSSRGSFDRSKSVDLTPATPTESTPSLKESNSESNSRKKSINTVRSRRAAHQESEQLIQEAIKIYKEKNSIRKAIQYLVSKQFMPDTPPEIASFLRVYKNHFDPAAIGDFLGEGGLGPEEVEYWSQIRYRYFRAITFVDLDLEVAVRYFLTECGFRMPGEAQRIDRLLDVFAKIYWQDNRGTMYCPFSGEKTVFVVTFAMILLNTDLHIANNKHKNRKMTKESFFSMLRGCDDSKDIEHEYLSRLYDNIKLHPIELPYNNIEETKHHSITPSFLSSGATGANRSQTQINATAAKSSTNGGNLDPDSTATGIGATGMLSTSTDFIKVDEKSFLRDMSRGLRDAEDLLRTLSHHTYDFQLTGLDTNISLDLVSCMYDTVWFHFLAITDTLLVDTQSGNDMIVTFAALEILSHSLTSAIFLGLKNEKIEFAKQLLEFRELCEPKANAIVTKQIQNDYDYWYEDVNTATPQTALETVSKLLKLIVLIKDAIQESNNYELTRQVANKIDKKADVLANNRYFVREGDLTKRNRGGGLTMYRFFLFSDHLIYAHQTMSGEYKVHEQMPLHLMSVADVETDNTGCSLFVNHPTKSFQVIAVDHASKVAWLHDLESTISSCKRRGNHPPNTGMQRRMSMLGRIHDQQEEQIKQKETLQKVLINTRSPDKNPLSRIRRDSLSIKEKNELRKQAIASMTLDNDEPVIQEISVNASVGEEKTTRDDRKGDDSDDTDSSPSPMPVDAEGRPLTMPPTPDTQPAKRFDRIHEFKDIVASLDERSLTVLFEKGVDFWKGTLISRSRRATTLTQDDDIIAHLEGLFYQGTYGDVTQDHVSAVVDSLALSTPKKLQAWKACTTGRMTPTDAMRQFLITMYDIYPYWKYDQFI